MARPFRKHWLFNGHDPDGFWDLEYLPIDDGEIITVEQLGDDIEPPEDDPTGSYYLPELIVPIEHFLDDKSASLAPRPTEWRADLKDRFLTRWAAHIGRCILILESKHDPEAVSCPVVRKDWLQSPAFVQGLFAAQTDLADIAREQARLMTDTHGCHWVALQKETAESAAKVLDHMAQSEAFGVLAVPKEKFEYHEFIAIPWDRWRTKTYLKDFLDAVEVEIGYDVDGLKQAGVQLKDGVATFTVDAWREEDARAWADSLVAYLPAMQYMDRSDRIPR